MAQWLLPLFAATSAGLQMAFCAHDLRCLLKLPRSVDLHGVACRLDAGVYQATGGKTAAECCVRHMYRTAAAGGEQGKVWGCWWTTPE